MQFGSYVKQKRLDKMMGLRRFCKATELDPSTWSKVERNLTAPTQNSTKLSKVAEVLELDDEEKIELMDAANVAAQRIPDDIQEDAELVSILPALFRTIRDNRPSEDELREYIKGLVDSERRQL